MDKKQASSIITGVFNNIFDKDKFIGFVGNLLNLNSADYSHRNIGIYDTYKQHVQSLEVVAKFSDGKNEIDVLIVTLVKDTSLDKARTMQRNFVARYLSEKQGDAAIVAFTSPDAEDWRFSLIKMESSFKKTDTGIKVEEEFTPAKRWSFLVGKNENSHTAQSQLVGILANDENAPTLEELEQAFSIETVTNEFFTKYTDLFLRMKESLDALLENDSQLKSDFEEKEIDTADFAKKTMGQMAFLYFLQKKGWFGVAPDKEWGTGVKNFLREIFERREKYGENFFDDVLEPLFYEALAQDRGNDSIYPKLNNCRMPFLNGGLFEPMNGYSWETTHIRLPDELFSNDIKTKEGDIGDGILDVFDRYNFTVNESEPLEQEVAVDPEMLGKVFENLLEIKDRKSKGAFYTPREIVHYMCQESLINYLETETNSLIPKVDIESFIQQGSQIIQNDKSIIEQGGDKGKLLLRQSVIDQAEELDDLLANIKVCDPAVGSGAFPLGMLNEIVTARTILGIHLRNNSSAYKLKLHAISNSIYGVDIDPGAVEIAKLRFWLSLVVEEDNPTPLPNLEHKIMQGNSLVSQYEGIELFDDDFLNSAESINDEKNKVQEKLDAIQKEYFSLHSDGEFTTARKIEIEEDIKRIQRRLKFLNNKNTATVETGSLFDMPQVKKIAQQKAKLLQSKIAQYVTVDSRTNKENLKKDIDDLKWDLIEATLEERDEIDKLDEIKKLRKDRIKPFFIWKLEFGDVFKDNGGFDVIIGNPPYIDSEGMINAGQKDLREYISKTYKYTKGNWDIYIAFFEIGLELLKDMAVLTYITPDKWLAKPFGKEFRKHSLKYITHLLKSGRDVFESVGVDSIVTIFSKKDSSYFKYLDSIDHVVGDIKKEIIKDPYQLDIVFSKNLELILDITNNNSTIKTTENLLFENACATSDCYTLKDILRDNTTNDNFLEDDYYKVINTGTIDQYLSKWGKKDMTYLRGKYLYPVVLKKEFHNTFPNSYGGKASASKLIIKGLTLLDASIDINGTTIPGKSTLILRSENIETLMLISAILNSKFALFYIKERYSASSYNTGINFTKDMLNNFPYPASISKEFKNVVIVLVKLILSNSLENRDRIKNVLNMAILELYFYDHMKELEIDIVRFIANDINTITENNNKNLTRIQKISLNDKINTFWNDSNNETFKRINSFSEKSPNILKPILEG